MHHPSFYHSSRLSGTPGMRMTVVFSPDVVGFHSTPVPVTARQIWTMLFWTIPSLTRVCGPHHRPGPRSHAAPFGWELLLRSDLCRIVA